ncbi:hypothetical protein [Streptomyces sp. NPDC006193]|uniref:hypothetical protein n=1 Tax=Streptomyces sp. NPDC006193 TaxID=3155717 RepID=UPI0033A6FB5D
MDSDQPVCPLCGQPVETVVRRHKTLGAWVPVWGPGPCRNPQCPGLADPGPTPGAPARPREGGNPSATGAENSAV